MSSKRRRTDGASNPRMRGAAIGARYASKFPYASYGTQRFAKGSMLAQAGASYREANAEQRAWRRANNYYGVGGFFGDLWSGAKKVGGRLIKAHGAKALGALGGAFGGPGGAAAGAAAGRALGLGRYNMGGVGSYGEIGNNAIVHGGGGDSMSVANVNPSMNDDSGDVILSHSEFIGNVVASAIIPAGTSQVTVMSTFQNSVYAINPGLQGTFPFLCQLAQNFTMYRLEGAIFQYKPTSGEGGGSTNQLGKIIMATDYDPMALPFINSVQMENYQYSQSTKPSLAARHGVECAPSQGVTDMKYVRTGTSNRDKSFTDYGLFQLATEGIPITGTQTAGASSTITSNVGELWISYKVRLSRANLYSSLLGYNIRNDIYDFECPVVAFNTSFNGTLINSPALNNIGCSVRFRSGAALNAFPDSFTIEWPVSQILGVYKITIVCSTTNAESGSTVAWVPSASTDGIWSSTDATKWGCPFTATRTLDFPIQKPGVNLTTGAPVPNPPIANATQANRLMYYATEVVDGSTPAQSMMSTYFAINSPTTTVAQLMFQAVAMSTQGAVVGFLSGFFATTSTWRIFIEQVNAEISN